MLKEKQFEEALSICEMVDIRCAFLLKNIEKELRDEIADKEAELKELKSQKEAELKELKLKLKKF